MLGVENSKVTHSEFAKKWKDQMSEAYKIAKDNSSFSKRKDRERRNGKRHLLAGLEVGDRVLIKNVLERGGPGKLRSHWEQDVYVVKEKMGEIGSVTYKVQKEDQPNSRMRVVHRNMLLPVSSLFRFEGSPKVESKKRSCDDKMYVSNATDDITEENLANKNAFYPNQLKEWFEREQESVVEDINMPNIIESRNE